MTSIATCHHKISVSETQMRPHLKVICHLHKIRGCLEKGSAVPVELGPCKGKLLQALWVCNNLLFNGLSQGVLVLLEAPMLESTFSKWGYAVCAGKLRIFACKLCFSGLAMTVAALLRWLREERGGHVVETLVALPSLAFDGGSLFD